MEKGRGIGHRTAKRALDLEKKMARKEGEHARTFSQGVEWDGCGCCRGRGV